MANKVRTHRGRYVDLDEIKMKNQEAVAIGNMNVNARGDEIDEFGNIVKSRDSVAREKNTLHKTATNARASVISAFEDDDDEMAELKDDPKAIERNKKQAESKTGSPTANKTQPAKAPDGKTGTSETKLD